MARLAPGAVAADVAARHHATLAGVTSDGRYVRLRMPASSTRRVFRAILSDPAFIVAEREQTFRSVAISRPVMVQKGSTIPAVWGRQQWTVANQDLLQMINWDPVLAASPGRQVRVAILDTGLAESANELWGKVVASRNFIEPGTLALDRPVDLDCNGDGIKDEGTGHGTLVAGIVDLVSPKAQLVIARVANSDGYATSWSIVEGLTYARQVRAEVVNISLADRAATPLLLNAVGQAEAAGITVVAAAGNENVNAVYSPSIHPFVVAVGALNHLGQKASFSNYHASIRASAPGACVTGPFWNGTTIQWSGTSFASAFVTGAVADCMRRNTRILPSRIRFGLEASGRPVNDPVYGRKMGKQVDLKSLDAWLKRNL